jgi:hypothetical protein
MDKLQIIKNTIFNYDLYYQPCISPYNQVNKMSPADLLFMLVSAALVMIMTSRLALFYGGLVGVMKKAF